MNVVAQNQFQIQESDYVKIKKSPSKSNRSGSKGRPLTTKALNNNYNASHFDKKLSQ